MSTEAMLVPAWMVSPGDIIQIGGGWTKVDRVSCRPSSDVVQYGGANWSRSTFVGSPLKIWVAVPVPSTEVEV